MTARVVLFAGQGAQRPGMGHPYWRTPAWEVVERIDDVTHTDVTGLMLHASSHDLADTCAAQLAVFTGGLLAHHTAREAGMTPTAVVGHSVGEVAALTAAGALDVRDAAHFVEERGLAMAEACAAAPGGMLALRGGPEVALTLAQDHHRGRVWVAAYNGPGETVLAGHADEIRALADSARQRRIPAMALPVAGAFHTPMMWSATRRTGDALRHVRFRTPEVPVASTADGRVHTTAAGWAERLLLQLTQPVRWTEAVAALHLGPASPVLDTSPSGALSRLLRREYASTTSSLSTPQAGNAGPSPLRGEG